MNLKGKCTSRFCLVSLLLYACLWYTSGHSVPQDGTASHPPTYDDISEDGHAVSNVTVEETNISAQFYLTKLVQKYGDGERMTFEGFEHFLQNLGLGQMFIRDHETDSHKQDNNSGFAQLHPNHNHSAALESSESTDAVTEQSGEDVSPQEQSKDNGPEYSSNEEEEHQHSEHCSTDKIKRAIKQEDECLSSQVMLRIIHRHVPSSLSKEMLKEMCPSLIYQIDADTCHKHHAKLQLSGDKGVPRGDAHIEHHQEDGRGNRSESSKPSIATGGASAKVWGYSSIAVLTISLVGLLGVAVIPIMQKVFYNHLIQFLVALAVGALSGDALLHLLPHSISGGHKSTGEGQHVSDDNDEIDSVLKGLCALAGIFFFFLVERVVVMVTAMRTRKQKKKLKHNKEYFRNDDPNMNDEKVESTQTVATKVVVHADGDADEGDSMIAQSHRSEHGHSHHPGGVPKSISAIAWMVILGDGVHNFSDGLAIGAAFSNSITGGFSTSIAVFCHELPHEIGDFAVLLKSGMSAKHAIIFNCVSSILCFLGMLVGIAIGNLENASLWIFAAVGGMFLYIALVDMLPQLSSADTKHIENPVSHLLLQCVGMLTGAGILLIIALYEDGLKTLLD